MLGWEEIQALMAGAPEVITEFYPEHADHLPQVIEALRALPSLEAKLAGLIERIDAKLLEPSNPHGSAVWEMVIRLADLAASRIVATSHNAYSPAQRAKLSDDLLAALTVLRYGPLLGGDPDAVGAARGQVLAIVELFEMAIELASE